MEPGIHKRGRHWVIINRDGHVVTATRYKTKRDAHEAYTHYIERGGETLWVGENRRGSAERERVPVGYHVNKLGYLSKNTPRDVRSKQLIKAGTATRFLRDGD